MPEARTPSTTPVEQAALKVCRSQGEDTDKPCAFHLEAVEACVDTYGRKMTEDALRLPCPVCNGDLYLFILAGGDEALVKCEGCGVEWDTTGPLTRRASENPPSTA